MANISNAERARRAAALAEAGQSEEGSEQPMASAEPDLTGLIKVAKSGEVLYVHPSALLQHKQLGWLEQ